MPIYEYNYQRIVVFMYLAYNFIYEEKLIFEKKKFHNFFE